MKRHKIAPYYSESFLEIERPQPLVDNRIEQLIQDVLCGAIDKDITDTVYANFKYEMSSWIFNSELNNVTGFERFDRIDIINGCTQFIDNIYMSTTPQVIDGDYRYHQRLGNIYKLPDTLQNDTPLIIAMPFPSLGATHGKMSEILAECLEKNIPVHIDAAWLTCCRDITFDLTHPAIHSIGISLSKGLGLGWNRIGLRWTSKTARDSITIMNDFNMNNRALAMIGLHFIRSLPTDYLWNTHNDRYYKICNDFNLTPTNSIYLALKNDQPVGVSPLIRYLENAEL